MEPGRWDVVVVGGGHNGLTAAAYLARAGRSVLVLEAADHTGGAAVSAAVFAGVNARLSRYSYLVSLLPRRIIDELGLPITLRRRRFSSYSPVPGSAAGLLVDNGDAAATARSFECVSGSAADFVAWQRFYGSVRRLAGRVFPTMLEPLRSRAAMRSLVDDEPTWRALIDEPIGTVVGSAFADDTVRGVVLTDALIGTFTTAYDTLLRANRCFLYHVIGGGTGDWDVPVGGMGSVTDALATAATSAGARIVTGAEVTAIDPAGEVSWREGGEERRVGAAHMLAAVAPVTVARLTGSDPTGALASGQAPEGAQLKVNMLLRRLPRLLDRSVDPVAAFGGTFHVNEGFRSLAAAYDDAAAARLPAVPPCEIYCHSLTDPSILGADLAASGAHSLTLFALHMPARLFRADNERARQPPWPRRCAPSTLCWPSRSGTACSPTSTVGPASRRAHRSTSRATSACRAGTSSTVTSCGPSPRPTTRSARGGWRPSIHGSCCAVPERGAAEGSAASPGAMRRWRC